MSEAYLTCNRIARMSRTNFYYSFLLLPARKREALMAVYAFCRITDDIADDEDPFQSRLSRIKAWREELDRTYQGRPTQPITELLGSVIRRYHIPKSYFENLIAGVEMDMVQSRYPTFESLYPYCFRVASTVGLICIEIFGYRSLETRRYAEELGVALQLTNILRDLRSDAERDRIYLPREDLDRFGCTEDDILTGKRTAAFGSLMEFQCERARSYFRKAWRSLPPSDRRSMVAAEAMGRIYYEILREIERRDYDVYARPVSIPRARKLGLALDVWVRKVLGLPRSWPAGLRGPAPTTTSGGPSDGSSLRRAAAAR